MPDTLPDRLSTDPDSPYYDAELLARDIGIRFKGAEKTNVEEYCVSEGWVRVAVGNKTGPSRQAPDPQAHGRRRALFPRSSCGLRLGRRGMRRRGAAWDLAQSIE